MAACFEVHNAVVLEKRSLFLLSGVVTDGMVQTGMRAVLEGAEDAFAETVHGVEFIPRAEGPPAGSEPALTFSYSNPEKLKRWQAIDWSGKKLQLSW